MVTIGKSPLPGILLTTIAHEMEIQRIVVRAPDQTSKAILEKLGATETFSPESKAASAMAKNLTVPFSVDSLPLTINQAIIKIKPPQEWVGKTIKEIGVRQNFAVNLIGVSHDDGNSFDFSPAVDKPFAESDLLLILGAQDRLKEVTG